MAKQDSIEFIEGIIDTVKADILSKVDQFPEHWAGAFLRLYIREKFNAIVWQSMKYQTRKYNNDCIINNL